MKLSTTIVTATSLLSSALAVDGKYGFIAVHSGDPDVHQREFFINENKEIGLKGGCPFEIDLALGELKTEYGYVYVKDNGVLALKDEGTCCWNTSNHEPLEYWGFQDFRVCKDNDELLLQYGLSSVCDNSVGVAVIAIEDQA